VSARQRVLESRSVSTISVQLNAAHHENKRSSFGALGGSKRGRCNVKTDDEPPLAGLTELAGRIWPAGRTLPTPGLRDV